MSDRKETPDVLGSILGGPQEPEVEPASKPESQIDRKTEKQKARKPEKQTEPVEEPKIKATHYLKQSTLYKLEEALIQLRRATDNRGLSRYEIVEEALQMALDELEAKGEKSQLARRMRGR